MGLKYLKEIEMIELCCGPFNGKKIKDLGTTLIKMSFEMNGKSFLSVYEPSEDRKLAFFLENQEDGEIIVEKSY